MNLGTIDLKTLLTNSGCQQDNIGPSPQCLRETIASVKPGSALDLWVRKLYAGSRDDPKGLLKLRNRSRVAHGFSEVNNEAIKKAGYLNGWPEIVNEAWEAAQDVFDSLDAPPYEDVAESIKSVLFPEVGSK